MSVVNCARVAAWLRLRASTVAVRLLSCAWVAACCVWADACACTMLESVSPRAVPLAAMPPCGAIAAI